MNEHDQNPNLIHKLWDMDGIRADGIIHDVFGIVQGNGCLDGAEPFLIGQRVDCKIHFGTTLHKAANQVTYTLPVWLILLNTIRSDKLKIREPEFARAGLEQPLIFDSFQRPLQLFLCVVVSVVLATACRNSRLRWFCSLTSSLCPLLPCCSSLINSFS